MKKSRSITYIGVLSALAIVLYFIEFPLFFYFPPFLKIDLSDIPAILGGIAVGPLAGIGIELVKNILHILIKGINTPYASGEIANFFAGVGLLIPIVVLLRKNKRNSFLAYFLGTILMVVIANVMNYFVTLPLYGINKDAIPAMVIQFLVPFNILKAVIVSGITAILYTKMNTLFTKQ